MTSGTAAGGVFVCRKMLRNAKTCQQVRKSWEVSLLDRKFFLTSAWTSPGVPVVGRWKIEPVGIPFFDSRAIFDFLAGRFGTSPALSRGLLLLRHLVEGRTCCSSLWMVCCFVVRSSGLLPIRALPFLPVTESLVAW